MFSTKNNENKNFVEQLGKRFQFVNLGVLILGSVGCLELKLREPLSQMLTIKLF